MYSRFHPNPKWCWHPKHRPPWSLQCHLRWARRCTPDSSPIPNDADITGIVQPDPCGAVQKGEHKGVLSLIPNDADITGIVQPDPCGAVQKGEHKGVLSLIPNDADITGIVQPDPCGAVQKGEHKGVLSLIPNDADITSIIHPDPCGAIQKGVDVGMLQAQEVATVQLAPLEVGLRLVVIQVKEDAHLHAFAVLQKTMNMVTETQVITIIK